MCMKQRFFRFVKRYRFTLALCGISVILWLASMWHRLTEILQARLEHAALCILGTTVVTLFFHREVREHFTILLSAKQAGMLNLYPRRSEETVDVMNHAAAITIDIDLLAIAGTDFLQRCAFLEGLE